MRGTDINVNCCGLRTSLTCPVTLRRTAGEHHTHAHMAEQPISLNGADGVSPGSPSANVEGGDPVGDVVANIGPRTTLASARAPETVLSRVKHEQRRSMSRGAASRSDSTTRCGSLPWITSRTRSLAWPCASFARGTVISPIPRLGSGPVPS